MLNGMPNIMVVWRQELMASQIRIWHDSSSYHHHLPISRCAARAYSSYPSYHGHSARLADALQSTGSTVAAVETTKRRDNASMFESELSWNSVYAVFLDNPRMRLACVLEEYGAIFSPFSDILVDPFCCLGLRLA